MGELHQVREKCRFFEKKYAASFEEVQQKALAQEENFELDDDLLEWKAYIRTEEDRIKKLEDIKHEQFQLA
jgi:hypothetical protein